MFIPGPTKQVCNFKGQMKKMQLKTMEEIVLIYGLMSLFSDTNKIN